VLKPILYRTSLAEDFFFEASGLSVDFDVELESVVADEDDVGISCPVTKS
jgi:hypothetical protein